jgi:hypothetical protein
VTATADSIPLIVASILSKKLAAGLDALVMDVKFGSRAFMREFDQAQRLAHSLVEVGWGAGLLVQVRLAATDHEALARLEEALRSGQAAERFAPIDMRALGLAVLEPGGGRRRAEDPIDHAMRFSELAPLGAVLEPGGPPGAGTCTQRGGCANGSRYGAGRLYLVRHNAGRTIEQRDRGARHRGASGGGRIMSPNELLEAARVARERASADGPDVDPGPSPPGGRRHRPRICGAASATFNGTAESKR